MSLDFQINIDCAEPAKLVVFWSRLLGYEVEQPPEGFTDWPAYLAALNLPVELAENFAAIYAPGKPRIYFHRSPERKIAKNRFTLVLNISGDSPYDQRKKLIEDSVDWVIKAGASRLSVTDEPAQNTYFTLMADPEGNEFIFQ